MSQYTLYVILSPLILMVGVAALWALIQRRSIRGAKALIWSISASIGYLICNTLELILPTPAETLAWAKISYLFLVMVPPAWLAFAMHYTGLDAWLTIRRFFWICLIPAATFLLVQTADLHSLIWSTVTFTVADGFMTMRVTHGQWFWVNMLYSYAVIVFGIGIIFRQFLISWHKLYRKQLAWILLGALLSLVSNLVYVFHLIPGWSKDYSPITIALTSVAFAIGILQYGLFEIVPIARSVVVEKLRDGVFVLNQAGQIVDVNPAAVQIAGRSHAQLIGRTLSDALSFWQETAMEKNSDLCTLTCSRGEQGERFYDVRIDELNDARGRLLGWLVSLRDVTERQMLLQKNRELAASDWLTELHNRRYFEELGCQEFERALRYQRPLSLLLIDLDHFKAVNDQWGHLTGDQVLQEYSRRLRSSLREFDLVARYGGEEIVVLLPDTGEKNAYITAERLWQAQQDHPIWTERSGEILLTVSIGISTLDPARDYSLASLIERADQAVYQAKARGRNRIEAWSEQPVLPTGLPTA